MRVLVVGAGIFGVTAARALGERGHRATVIDPGPVPHPLAESTDISKVVRIEYGPDEDYMALGERAVDGWRRWNRERGEALYHETGVAFLARAPMAPGGFEHDSYAALLRRGHRPERVDAAEIARRFPAFRPGVFVDGFVHAVGGWVAAGRVVARLAAGLDVVRGRVARLVEEGGRVAGVVLDDGQELRADAVVLTTGAWIVDLAPWLAGSFHSVGQPVFHVRPRIPPELPVFGADIARTGWYGFPAQDGLVKLANHGLGRRMHPGSPDRAVTAAEETALHELLADALPGLAGAPIVATRICVYCDTLDGHFWIAADPERAGLVVATGGSGHAFKFAPLLGDLVADAALGAPGIDRFRWRPELARAWNQEAARHKG